MALDFTTLYVVILLNSVLLGIVWVVVYRAYDRLEAAGIWALACLTLIASGATLASEAIFGSLAPIYAGNLLLVFSFSLYWVGIRRFEDRPVLWWPIVALTLTMALVLVPITFLAPNYNARNVVYAIAQSAPLLVCILELARGKGRYAGRYVTMAAMGLAIFGHLVETAGNFLMLAGFLAPGTYAVIEPAIVLVVIFSGSMWNFGLVLMVIDRLYAALEHKATHDELTGLPNRRALAERLATEIAAAGATGRPLAMLVVDLDGLKELNDRYGHLAGDAGIVHVARTVSARLRAGDMIARTGGDEFCVVLPRTTNERAGAMAAALVGAVRSAPLALEKRLIPLTLSVGAAEWVPGQSLDAFTATADIALYAAKDGGRNGFAVAGADGDVLFMTEAEAAG